MPLSKLKLGYTEYKVDYVVKYTEHKDFVDKLILNADVVICGEAPATLVKQRIKHGLLTFKDDERRYKALIKYLKWPIYTYESLVFNKGYLLSASAYGARDYILSGMKPDRCFKWGYFTEVKTYEDINTIIREKSSSPKISLLWACRLVGWKHPELAIKLAKLLKRDGYCFELSMVGMGPLDEKIRRMVRDARLEDVVTIIGPLKQEELRVRMEKSEIFLSTSDQNEGWGATINESMNSGCAVVASHAIGAVPFLIKDGENGLTFKSRDLSSLYKKVKSLIDNPDERKRLGYNAYCTMQETWNSKRACRNLLLLIDALLNGRGTPIEEGPCSKAEVINS